MRAKMSAENAASTAATAEGPNESVTRSEHRTRSTLDTARSAARRGPLVHMSSTEAQNGFGRVLDTVARGGKVMITKHNTTQAVVMSVEEYDALTQAPAPELDLLTAEFDELLLRMQTPHARAGLRDAFGASPDELSRAAVAAARRTAQ